MLGIPLQELKLKPNLLISSISHKGNVVIPRGQSVIRAGDSVVIVTTLTGLHDIKDILA